MQTRQLARLIVKSHRRTKSWQHTADEFNKQYGVNKSKGWYFKVATGEYDPKNKADRDSFGLGPRPCPTCHRKITTPRPVRVQRISDMPSNALLDALMNREPVDANYNPRVMNAFIKACKQGGLIHKEKEVASSS